MTNKEKYISSFSGVEPSDEIKERILNMASTKKRYSFKALAVVLAVLIIVAAAMITANAATDGAIGDKVIELSKEISEKISVVVNGKEIEATFNYKPITDENGKTSIVEIVIPETLPENLPENEQGEDEIVFALDEAMEDVGKIVLQKSEESTENVEIDLKTETDNYKVVVKND
ncbi:MAG: hypothetical protein E7547_04610 [Ruminococcaceae bacterium]|nr:hypothetical protein [Oscillospiraceae bacterium]